MHRQDNILITMVATLLKGHVTTWGHAMIHLSIGHPTAQKVGENMEFLIKMET